MVEVKIGSTVPVIKNVRAMPVPTAAMWPQILCDFEFDGGTPEPDALSDGAHKCLRCALYASVLLAMWICRGTQDTVPNIPNQIGEPVVFLKVLYYYCFSVGRNPWLSVACYGDYRFSLYTMTLLLSVGCKEDAPTHVWGVLVALQYGK